MPEKNRILLANMHYLHEHYIKEPFNAAAPHNPKIKWLRPRNKQGEHTDRMRYFLYNINQILTRIDLSQIAKMNGFERQSHQLN